MKKEVKTTVGWIAVVGGLASAAALLTSVLNLGGRIFPSDSLEVGVVSVESLGRPTVRITLRNTTADPMVLTRAELTFDQAQVTERDTHASTELTAIPYTWIITSLEAEKKLSSIPLSRRLEGKEPIVVDFVMGFERPHTTFDARATLHVTYNDGRKAESTPFALRIVNDAGQFPQFDFPTTDSDLINALRGSETGYAVRQIIDELARRQVQSASPDVQRHLASADPATLTAVANYFRAVRDPSACTGLAKLVTSDDAQVRRAAMGALVAQGDPAVPEVERLADSASPAVRQAALTMLGELPGERSVNRLRQALDDRTTSTSAMGEPIVTTAVAIRALARLRAVSESGRIVQKLSDRETGVAEAAIDAVVEMQIREALPALRQMASGGNATLRDQATEAVAALTR